MNERKDDRDEKSENSLNVLKLRFEGKEKVEFGNESKCKMCDKTFSKIKDLRRHITRLHNNFDEARPFH